MLATQCLPQSRPRSMRVHFEGERPPGVTAKDMILGAIGQIGVAGGVGHVLEYTGEAIRALSMENRMTVCNMSIEAGARAGMIGPTTRLLPTSKAGRRRRAGQRGSTRSTTGARCAPIPTPPTTAR